MREAQYPKSMRHFAVSAIGRDRPGIVAAVSAVLLEHNGNVEDSQMTILRGRFTIMLIVSAPDGVDLDRLEADLERARERLGLDALAVGEVSDVEPPAEAPPSHVVSVYGVDHPGIMHAVTSTLAAQAVNIVGLTTRLVGDERGEPLYAMMMEVTLPSGLSAEALERSLRGVGEQQGVDLTIGPLEQDVL
jgi:glycine cleavage system transcriptional repressor